jgi:uncharacterized protein with ATP-grasp and redox domains
MKIQTIVVAIATVVTLAQSAEASPQCRKATSANKVADAVLDTMSTKPGYSSEDVDAMIKVSLTTNMIEGQLCGNSPDSLRNWTKAEQNAAVKSVTKAFKVFRH